MKKVADSFAKHFPEFRQPNNDVQSTEMVKIEIVDEDGEVWVVWVCPCEPKEENEL